jgi:glyoxylase-like metal-dependent hydrolase (beta-lactamase superfamily II)
MAHNVRRRDFLGCGVGAGLGLALPAGVGAFARPQRKPSIAGRLADHLVVVTTKGSNVLVVSGEDDTVLIGGGAPEQGRDLLYLVERETRRSVVPTLINTHWHSAHTGVNERLGKRGAKIIAHENTKLWMQADIFVEWEGRTYAPRRESALPNVTTYDSGEITCGRERIRYVHLPQAHTDGDLYAFLPEANVLVTGDLLHVGRYPVIDYSSHGWIGGYLDATEALLKVADSQTRIVPGEGPVQTRAALEAQHALCKAAKTRLIESFRQGNSLEEFIASMPTRELDGSWGGDPVPFLTMAYRGAMGHLYELIEGVV